MQPKQTRPPFANGSAGSKGDGGSSANLATPAISPPKGGGAVRGIGEKFSTNPATGTASLEIPLSVPPGRGDLGPQLALHYGAGQGNGPFGLGWSLGLLSISRKTDKGVPEYLDSDVFILAGSDDLVPIDEPSRTVLLSDQAWTVRRFRPRVESQFLRIEYWTSEGSASHWRITDRENVTSVLGATEESRIAHAEHPARVLTWLCLETRDDRGNVVRYDYKAEDAAGLFPEALQEQSRFEPVPGAASRFRVTAQRYLKRVRYANREPVRSEAGSHFEVDTDPDRREWSFHIIFDYGEHGRASLNDSDLFEAEAFYDERAPWRIRLDPFSTYRPGFELRTQRLCERVLVFHHFPELGPVPMCVSQQLFGYEKSLHLSKLVSTEFNGLVSEDGKLKGDRLQALPPLRLEYTTAASPREVLARGDGGDAGMLAVTGSPYRWVDLDGEGIAGVLWAEEPGWRYRRNLGSGNLAAPSVLRSLANPGAMDGDEQLVDVNGDGRLDLVQFTGAGAGFYSRTEEGSWAVRRNFSEVAHIDMGDPDLRFVDLTGDGLADILITRDDSLLWLQSHGSKGFASAERRLLDAEENEGPRGLFSNRHECLFLADMNGDGLVDLVRIRNGSVCYWPSLGHARFGRKVTLANAPQLDNVDDFDPKRIRLADVDGSGSADVIYLRRDRAMVYANQAGNSLAQVAGEVHFPGFDSTTSVDVTDVLGHGTACLVWSSPLPGHARSALRIIDLMGGTKPHLLRRIDNGFGGITEIDYTTSTSQYLEDRAQGRPWLTRLSFPVQLVRQVVRLDLVADTRITTGYTYRHGYYDGVEREFRGFGFVEQTDAQAFCGPQAERCSELHETPPVVTRTWFHTGAWLERGRLEEGYALEYYSGDSQAVRVPDSRLPAGLAPEEMREAVRALNGRVLRVETYGMDADGGAALYPHPYTVTEHAHSAHRLQPRDGDRSAVFHVHEAQSIHYRYERHPDHPRIAHDIVLAVDAFGNVVRRATIAYAHRNPAAHDVVIAHDTAGKIDAREAQIPFPHEGAELEQRSRCSIAYTQAWFANDAAAPARYRIGVPTAASRHEISGLVPAGPGASFEAEEIDRAFTGATEVSPGATPPAGVARRLVELQYYAYWSDTVDSELPIGEIGARALPRHRYALAFTEPLLDMALGADKQAARLLEARLPKPRDRNRELGYLPMHELALAPDAVAPAPPPSSWWRPSGYVLPDKGSFFEPLMHADAFGGETRLEHKYALFLVESKDALGNLTRAQYDFRVLAARRVVDANGNVTEFTFEPNGKLGAIALVGKGEGDTLASPTRRYLYELNRGLAGSGALQPMRVITREREAHLHAGPDPRGAEHGAPPGERETFVYTDGSGREALTMLPAEPGNAPLLDERGELILDGDTVATGRVERRWVGSGRTVYDNMGNVVRKYEPFFWSTPEFPANAQLRQWGVTPILRYDPAGRLTRADNPDGTYRRVAFSAWHVEHWDENDTVLEAPLPGQSRPSWHDRMSKGTAEQKRAAAEAARHAATPQVELLDAFGRVAMSATQDERGGYYRSRAWYDLDGRILEVHDASGRVAARNRYDLLGRQLAAWLADSGTRLAIPNAADHPAREWNDRGFDWRILYDDLRRPTHRFVSWPKNAMPKLRADAGTQAPEGDDEAAEEAGGLFAWFSSLVSPAAHDETERLNHEGKEILLERLFYGEAMQNPERVNARGRLVAHYDDAGLLAHGGYDFKGNLLGSARQLVGDYRSTPDWRTIADVHKPDAARRLASSLLEAEAYTTGRTYDALDHLTTETAPDGSVVSLHYNDASLLETVAYKSDADAGSRRVIVEGIDYNARGQRVHIAYGNGVDSNHDYDPTTFLLRELRSSSRNSPARPLQRLRYTYDAVGNIVAIHDDADATHFFNGNVVPGHQEFGYDHLYQLKEATGREHPYTPPSPDEILKNRLPHPNDKQALRRYVERYEYDRTGNLTKLSHQSGSVSWVREQRYEATSNRLVHVGGAGSGFSYEHDAGGNLNHMPHLAVMQWDASDRLRHAARNREQLVWYAYAGDGQRVRKVFENQRTIEETIYIGSYEVYRRRPRGTGSASYARSTRHVTEGDRAAACIETVTADRGSDSDDPVAHVRYQIRNHLGSSSVELNDAAQVISYEEHHAFGSSAVYVSRASNTIPKRHRYTGKERDKETGLHYFGARYYAGWLARWTSSDPVSDARARSAYMYVSNDPINKVDPDGRYEVNWSEVRQGAGDVAVAAAIGAAAVAAAVVLAPVIGAATVAVVGATGAAALASAGSALLTTAAVVGTAHLVQRQTEAMIGSDFATGKSLSDAERSYRLGEGVGVVATFGLAKLGSSIKGAWSASRSAATNRLNSSGQSSGVVPSQVGSQPRTKAGIELLGGSVEHVSAASGLGNQNPLYKAAVQQFKTTRLSNAGRGLTKHPEVIGQTKETLRDVLKTEGAINDAAHSALRNIMRNGVTTTPELPRYGTVTQIQVPGGFGARWQADGKFIGFINP